MAKTALQQIADVDAAIVKLQAKRAELVTAAQNEVDPAKLVAGANIEFAYGKGDTKKNLVGMILGVKLADPEQPKSSTMLRVAVGEGFDAQIVTVYPAQVTKIVTVAEIEDAAA